MTVSDASFYTWPGHVQNSRIAMAYLIHMSRVCETSGGGLCKLDRYLTEKRAPQLRKAIRPFADLSCVTDSATRLATPRIIGRVFLNRPEPPGGVANHVLLAMAVERVAASDPVPHGKASDPTREPNVWLFHVVSDSKPGKPFHSDWSIAPSASELIKVGNAHRIFVFYGCHAIPHIRIRVPSGNRHLLLWAVEDIGQAPVS